MPWKGSESGESHGTRHDKPVGDGLREVGEVEFAVQCIWNTLAASRFFYLRYLNIVFATCIFLELGQTYFEW